MKLYQILQLIHTPKEDKKGPEEWGEFLHLPGQIFGDFNEIRAEIIRDTDKLTGDDKGQTLYFIFFSFPFINNFFLQVSQIFPLILKFILLMY